MSLCMDKIYKKTRFLQTVREDNLVAIWHSLFGNPKTVSPETMDFIEKFSIPKTLRSVVGDSINAETINVLNELVDCYFLTLEDFDDRTLLKDKIKQREEKIINGSLIDYLELIMSETCNFACDYCIHFKNLGISLKRISPWSQGNDKPLPPERSKAPSAKIARSARAKPHIITS